MKTTYTGQYLMTCLVVGVLSLVFLAPLCVLADEYGFEQKDRQEEQTRYMVKLTQDKKKVELAIQNTKALIHRARNKPYLPELYIRLAELYIEESRIVFYIRKTKGGDAVSALDQMESNTLKNQAIEIYQRILNDFPEFEARDKVHFFMAHEYRELNQIDDMVLQYRTIIKQYPQSQYVPESYLLLGDYFISRQDLDTAKKHYEAILNYPDSTAISIARYKLGWCFINQQDFCSAMKLFEGVVGSSESGKELEIDTYKRVNIKQEALMDMAYCYTECNGADSAEKALAYFQSYSWSRQVYTAVLEKLAYRYYIKKKWSHSVVVYRQLSMLEQDPARLLEYARNIFESVQATGGFENADQDMAIIIKALRKEKYSIHVTDEQKAKDLADYELYARNIVTYLHDEARNKKSEPDFRRAADAYELYLDFFDTSPVYAEMSANYAEALFSAHDYLGAGRQYEKLAGSGQDNGPEREERLYSAVISYYDAVREKEKLNYFELAYAREGLKATGRQYASDYPASPRVPDVWFNVAWVSYDAGDYETAIRELTKYVETYPDGTAAKAAVHLVLDAYSIREDYEGLVAFGNSVAGDAQIKDRQLKDEVLNIVQNTQSKVISSLTVAALDDWDKGKSELIEYASRSQSSGMGEQALHAVVVSSRERGDVKTLLTTGTELVRQYPASDKVEGTLNMMIDNAVQMAQFRLVADYLESFAQRMPDHKNTRDFLLQAGHIRKGLGQYDRSTRDYRRLLDLKPSDAAVSTETVFAVVDNDMKTGDKEEAIQVLSTYRDRLSDSGRIRADATIAALYLEAGDAKSAEPFLKRAEKAYPSKAAQDDAVLNRAMARMVYAALDPLGREYMGLRLQGDIDNQIVAAKTGLLDRLEKGYQRVMQLKSAEWILKACYRSSLINSEFARFLRESPLPPELADEQKEQYAKIIGQKAQSYADKADQYRQAALQQGRKWEVCDPELAGYFSLSDHPAGAPRRFSSFSGTAPVVEIADQCLADQDLRDLHGKLLKNRDDAEVLLELCEAYMHRDDYPHAIMIAQKALEGKKEPETAIRARILNCLGVSLLYMHEDSLAHDAFRKAVSADSTNTGARINLAGLLSHYGHAGQSILLYEGLPALSETEKTKDAIHPRAKELYHVSLQVSKN